MQKKIKNLLIITNLHPVPWAPNRASFNRQQFSRLEEHFNVSRIVLVPFLEWFKNRSLCLSDNNTKYLPFFYLPKFGRRFYPFFQYLSLLFVHSWIKRSNPHVLLASWAYPDAVAVNLLNKVLKLPLFIKIHGSDINGHLPIPSRRKQIKKAFNNATGVFSVSEALRQKLIKIGVADEKIFVNYNGVDKNIFFPSRVKHNNSIVFVGNLIKEKGILELLNAFEIIQKSRNDVYLKIIGNGVLENQVKQLILEKKLTSSVSLSGSLPLNEVAHEIRNAILLVLPSYREGVPNVILESLASGTPVVATNVGGIPEVLFSECGIIVHDLAALAETIFRALDEPWDKNIIVEHAQKYDWDKNVQYVVDKFTQAIEQNESIKGLN